MSARLERAWADVAARLDAASLAALVTVLDRRGSLSDVKDRAVAEVTAEELRADVAGAASLRALTGKLGQAISLIRAGEAKDTVLAAGISRRTFYRAQQECQGCQRTPTRTARLIGS